MRTTTMLAMVCLLLLAVSCSARGNIRNASQQLQPAMEISSSDFFQTGIASWYGDDFHGKTTANGEIYDMQKLTAAHRTLPFHTMVEVENLENGKRVLVRINDRGPFLKNRIIDLSLHAAQRLAMTGKGTAAVNIRLIRWNGASLPTDSAKAVNSVAECCVQAGAFTVRENADELLMTLVEIFPDLRFSIIVEDEMFKVLSEKFPAVRRCQEIIDKMADYHLQGFIRAL
ncbi:MAG: septal ring lytic transglycosylase RlpA family protein [Chrysiogenales bacterium]